MAASASHQMAHTSITRLSGHSPDIGSAASEHRIGGSCPLRSAVMLKQERPRKPSDGVTSSRGRAAFYYMKLCHNVILPIAQTTVYYRSHGCTITQD